ncbi:M23 family metallopeptidase, partial [Algiphilus sp. NNCM1]|nr:M23 family metallopeptidase [Algiphilus acroporae]
MDEREYRRRIRRNRIAQEEKKRIRQQLRQTMVVCALACVMLLVCCLWSAEPTYAKTNAATASGSCTAMMRWPLNGAQVVGKYDAPKQQWLPGHRGVDLLADPQEAIVAPADGVIAFSGNVGGKAVVTIRHGGDLSGLTSTFEPAI